MEDKIMQQLKNAPIEEIALASFRAPEGKEGIIEEGKAQEVAITSIVGVASHTFTFRENANTPGRTLEASTVVTVPAGAGFFTMVNTFSGAFTTSDFQFLRERPMGQFFVNLGLRGNNFVCRVRLTDANSDDPILISVTGIIAFFR